MRDLSKQHKTKEIAQIHSYIDRLKEHGHKMNSEFPGSIKHIKDDIYELRPGNNRVFFFFYDGQGGYVLLHGFTKKSNETPEQEIKKAIAEKNDFLGRNGNG